MPSLERGRRAKLIDSVWRMALRVGFRLARVWWHLRRPSHEGALVAIYVGRALLLVKSSYRDEWNLPGGSVNPGETPDEAAQREMEEEIGLSSFTLLPAEAPAAFGTGVAIRCISLNCTSITRPNCGSIIVKSSRRIWHRRKNCRACP